LFIKTKLIFKCELENSQARLELLESPTHQQDLQLTAMDQVTEMVLNTVDDIVQNKSLQKDVLFDENIVKIH
jgi:hypothetical protein